MEIRNAHNRYKQPPKHKDTHQKQTINKRDSGLTVKWTKLMDSQLSHIPSSLCSGYLRMRVRLILDIFTAVLEGLGFKGSEHSGIDDVSLQRF